MSASSLTKEQTLRDIVEYAYKMGYHEPGYDVVADLLEHIRRRVGVSYEALGLSDDVESLPPELRDSAKVRERGEELLKTGLTFVPACADVKVSDDGQVVTIFGVRYAIEVFRHLAFGPIGSRIEIMAREDGMVTLRRLPDEPKPGHYICECCGAEFPEKSSGDVDYIIAAIDRASAEPARCPHDSAVCPWPNQCGVSKCLRAERGGS